MKTVFYPKLALINLLNNRNIYLPYIITCTSAVIMFYNISALTFNRGTGEGNLAALMYMGMWVVAIFAAVFLFYTNSFIVKKRQREFGLFNILGMEKKHIGRVMLWETLIICAVSLISGLAFGLLLSKLITMLLYKILHFDPNFHFEISLKAIVWTLGLFGVIFFITLITSLIRVYRAKPVQLLQSEAAGEKEPRSNLLLFLLGVLTLGGGYYMSLRIRNPLSALNWFFIAVILVIVGTYCLFTAGSIVILKALRKNKSYYYKTKHFVALSGMLYRMKKNAAGLASICIMSTMVLVMISTTVSLYAGMDNLMDNRFPREVIIEYRHTPDDAQEAETVLGKVDSILTRDEIRHGDLYKKEFLSFSVLNAKDGRYEPCSDSDFYSEEIILISATSCKSGANGTPLKNGEVIIYSEDNEKYPDEISILGKRFTVADISNDASINTSNGLSTALSMDIALTEEDLLDLYEAQQKLYGEHASKLITEISFDFDEPDGKAAQYCTESFLGEIYDLYPSKVLIDVRQLNVETFYELYGGLFFLGIFLGFLFMLATVLIIYYKQVTEGIEDTERYRILQNVGMSKEEVRTSVDSQILTVFALPLLAALVHVAVAFPILTKMLSLFNLTNVTLFAVCTLITSAAFAVIYTAVYLLTSKVYYKTVNRAAA